MAYTACPTSAHSRPPLPRPLISFTVAPLTHNQGFPRNTASTSLTIIFVIAENAKVQWEEFKSGEFISKKGDAFKTVHYLLEGSVPT